MSMLCVVIIDALLKPLNKYRSLQISRTIKRCTIKKLSYFGSSEFQVGYATLAI